MNRYNLIIIFCLSLLLSLTSCTQTKTEEEPISDDTQAPVKNSTETSFDDEITEFNTDYEELLNELNKSGGADLNYIKEDLENLDFNITAVGESVTLAYNEGTVTEEEKNQYMEQINKLKTDTISLINIIDSNS